MGVQATPIRARRAAHDYEWPLGPHDANDTIAILGPVEVPGHAPRARAQVERPSRENSEARPPLNHGSGSRRREDISRRRPHLARSRSRCKQGPYEVGRTLRSRARQSAPAALPLLGG
eukprot:13450142-Alexandrium_andersonii.AAC.1